MSVRPSSVAVLRRGGGRRLQIASIGDRRRPAVTICFSLFRSVAVRSVLAAAASRCEGRSSGSDLRTRLPARRAVAKDREHGFRSLTAAGLPGSRTRFPLALRRSAAGAPSLRKVKHIFGAKQLFAAEFVNIFRFRRFFLSLRPRPGGSGRHDKKRTLMDKLLYTTSGTCSRAIEIELEGDAVRRVLFHGGCQETPAASPRWSKGCRSRRWSADWRGLTAAARGPRVPTSWLGRCARCAPNRLAGSVRRDNCT